ncbi:MAG TPA: NADH-quinone oxidoreductase subunit J [Bacteroidales bacterium]|nr:NADH-quinone oxidoreductase subunit J [Bacteroidales bacterium]
MNIIFYIAAAVAVVSTFLAITGRNAIHALLFLILSLLSISVIFYILGAPFIAALEVIIYAGAIMVLFIFVIMMLNIGQEKGMEKKWMHPRMWVIPSLLAFILLLDFVFMLYTLKQQPFIGRIVLPKEVGISLFTTYLLGVEISGMLLLAGIVGAYHLGRQKKKVFHRFLEKEAVPETDEKVIQ